MPDADKVLSPLVETNKSHIKDTPYKIVFAYDGNAKDTTMRQIAEFYETHNHIGIERRPNMIHVLGKYVIIRQTAGKIVALPDGRRDPNQPDIGEFKCYTRECDITAFMWLFNDLQLRNQLIDNCMFNYSDWINRVVARMLAAD